MNSFGQVLAEQKWEFMDSALNPTDLTELFQSYTCGVLDIFCPQKIVYARPDDLPYITEKMKTIKRQIMREYEKRGKSVKYYELRAIFMKSMEKEVSRYKNKIIEDVKTGNKKSVYSALRKLGVRPGESSGGTFTLPEHANLSAQQAAGLMADHFSLISQNYAPIDIRNFPPKMREVLLKPQSASVPVLEQYQVYKKICKAKKPNSTVPGDLPKRIIQEFSCELAAPVTVIYNAILQTHHYPRQWVVEEQVPIPKQHPPSSMDELRNISKTAFFSKVFESFLSDWLLPIVEPYLDPCQYGLKGASITHYLLRLLKFIHKYLDLKDPHAVIVALVDLSKAFNRVSLSMVIEDLYAMHVPPWLLLILISYLSGRSMVLRYKGASSSPRNLPGSSPQGAFLGIFCFIVKYNGAALRPQIPRLMFQNVCKKSLMKTTCPTPSCDKHPKDTHCIYIDDLSEAEAVRLKQQLVRDPVTRPMPLKYHERTGHIYPAQNSLL